MDTPPSFPTSSSAAAPYKKTFFHHIATASVVALVLGVILGVALVVVMGNPVVMGLLVIAGFMVFTVGVLLGIVALCGIPSYGTRGILVKGLCGVLGPILLVAIAVPVAGMAMIKGGSMTDANVRIGLMAAEETVKGMKGEMVDEATRLDDGQADAEARTFTYIYTLPEVKREDLDVDVFFNTLRPGLINPYRNHPDLRFFRDNEVALIYRYFDSDGVLIGEVTVGPDDLEEPQP